MSTNVFIELNNHGINLREDWISENLPGNHNAEDTFQKICCCDIKLSSNGSLPSDITSLKSGRLKGCHFLQVQHAINIHQPLLKSDKNDSKRFLKLILNDGKNDIVGLEYKPIPELDTSNIKSLAKVLIYGDPYVARGALLLGPKNIKVVFRGFQGPKSKPSDIAPPQNSKNKREIPDSASYFDELMDTYDLLCPPPQHIKSNHVKSQINRKSEIKIEDFDLEFHNNILNTTNSSTIASNSPEIPIKRDKEESKLLFSASTEFNRFNKQNPVLQIKQNIQPSLDKLKNTFINYISNTSDHIHKNEFKESFFSSLDYCSNGKSIYDDLISVPDLQKLFWQYFGNQKSHLDNNDFQNNSLKAENQYVNFENKLHAQKNSNLDRNKLELPLGAIEYLENNFDFENIIEPQKHSVLSCSKLKTLNRPIFTIYAMIWDCWPIADTYSTAKQFNSTKHPQSIWEKNYFDYKEWCLCLKTEDNAIYVIAPVKLISESLISLPKDLTCKNIKPIIENLIGFFEIEMLQKLFNQTHPTVETQYENFNLRLICYRTKL